MNKPGKEDLVLVCAMKEHEGQDLVIGSMCVRPEHSLLAEVVLGVLSPRVQHVPMPQGTSGGEVL